MAVESALTGHLVLSTMHTNSAAATVVRLLEMDVEPYLISSTLVGVLAQRLVRCNCPHCLEPEFVDPGVQGLFQLDDSETFYRGRGCEQCQHTGIVGRQAVYELLKVTVELRHLIKAGVSTDTIQKQAHADGLISLTEQALQLARQKLIPLSEVYRVRLE